MRRCYFREKLVGNRIAKLFPSCLQHVATTTRSFRSHLITNILALANLDGSSARARGPLAYVIQPELQPVRLRRAEPELWLALSTSDAPEHPGAGARACGPPCAPRRQ